MSKLTGWIDNTDSLDIQGIVDKYEAELIENNNHPSKATRKETTVLDGQEIWSGSIEDLLSQKTKKVPSVDEKIATPINNIEKQETQPIKFETTQKFEKTQTLKLEQESPKEVINNTKTKVFDFDFSSTIKEEAPKVEAPKVDTRRPEVPKFEIPGSKPSKEPTINFNKVEEKIETIEQEKPIEKVETVKFDLPNPFTKSEVKPEVKQTINFDKVEEVKQAPSKTVNLSNLVKEEPNVEVKAEPKEETHSYKDEMVKKQLSELAKAKAELEAANELVRQQLAEMQKAKEELEIAKQEESKAAKFVDSKTINFESEEKTSKDEIRLDNPNTKLLDEQPKAHKANTIRFVDKDEEEQKAKELNRFNAGVDYYKILEQNDCKTVKFQPTGSQLSKFADDDAKVQPDENLNTFSKRLTKIFFNETQKAEDLDLTRELDHSKGISVEEKHESSKKQKRGIFGFLKKKK